VTGVWNSTDVNAARMQNFAAISYVTHILLILVAVTLVVLVSLERTEVATQVMNWALLVLLLIHLAAIYAEHKWGRMSMIAMLLVVLALANAIVHHIGSYPSRAASATTGLVAGAVIVSFFVFHATMPAIPTFRRPDVSRFRDFFRRSARVGIEPPMIPNPIQPVEMTVTAPCECERGDPA
jgi:hypothetical protein